MIFTNVIISLGDRHEVVGLHWPIFGRVNGFYIIGHGRRKQVVILRYGQPTHLPTGKTRIFLLAQSSAMGNSGLTFFILSNQINKLI